jgi:hypothetical protein
MQRTAGTGAENWPINDDPLLTFKTAVAAKLQELKKQETRVIIYQQY